MPRPIRAMLQKGTHKAEIQGVFINTVVKPTMTYGAECWADRKKDENIACSRNEYATMDKG